MRVHNLYSDLLRSITYLFDNIIYDKDTIKYYEFNIGNQTFQLNYKTNYKLPAANIRLQAARPINLHPTNIQRLPIENINRIPVIYNRTKNLTIEVQEEHFLIDIDLDINCESQLQAKDLEFQLLSTLPLNKWFYIYSFTSFFEIENSKILLDNEILDTNEHDIVNLFVRYDYNLGKPVHSFGVNYQPYINLQNCQVSIPSSQERSYQVNVSLQYMIQFPQYLIIPVHERPSLRTVPRKIIRKNIVYNCNNNFKLLELSLVDNTDNSHVKVIVPYNEYVTFIDPRYGNTGSFESELKQEIIFGKFKWLNLKANMYNDVDGELKITRNIDLSTDESQYPEHVVSVTAQSFGRLNGNIHNIEHDDRNKKLLGVFEGVFDNTYVKDNIEIEYQELYRTYKIHYDHWADIDNYATEEARIITQTRNIFYLVPELNEFKTHPILDRFKIVSIYILNNDENSSEYNEIYSVDLSSENIYLDREGYFRVEFYLSSLGVNGFLNGRIDPRTRIITTQVNYNQGFTENDLPLLALGFDMEFLVKPSYGGVNIERITIDITSTDSVMTTIPLTKIIDDLEQTPTHPERRQEVRLVVLDSTQIRPFEEFILNNDIDKDYHTLIIRWPEGTHKPDYDIWRFRVNDLVFDSTSQEVIQNYNEIYPIQLESEDAISMTFKIKKDFYYKELKRDGNLYPLIFYLIKLD